jgi:hypothetical protein
MARATHPGGNISYNQMFPRLWNKMLKR